VIPIVSVVGRSDSGKTTLVEGLVAELSRRGYRVGTIKHSPEGFSMDVPGKDSYRHRRAGAVVAGVASSDQLGLVRDIKPGTTLFEIAEMFFADVDILVAEGYKSAPIPKIVVQHLDADGELAGEIVAQVGESTAQRDVPRFSASDTSCLADLIESRYLTVGH